MAPDLFGPDLADGWRGPAEDTDSESEVTKSAVRRLKE